MNLQTIQQLMLIRAVEESDVRGEQLPFSEREDATRQALAEKGELGKAADSKKISPKQWAFLARRAEILHERLKTADDPLSPTFGTSKTVGGICLVAFGMGCASHVLGLARSFDIVALPFLLLMLWNAVVYGLILYGMIRPTKKSSEQGLIGSWLTRWMTGGKTHLTDDNASQVYQMARVSWLRSWLSPAIVSWFHAGSACFVLGLLATVYCRGLNTDYFVGWESAWLSANSVKTIIGSLLSPASWISGIEMPASLEDWNQLNWHSNMTKVRANPWIHLYAITLLGWVIIPRTLLAFVSSLNAKRLRSSPPPWHAGERYVMRIFNQSRPSDSSRIAILPFDSKNVSMLRDGKFRDNMERLVRETWGQGAIPCWLQCAPYGEEEAVFTHHWSDALSCEGAVLLLDMNATPEAEVHGALIDAVVKQFANSDKGLLTALESKCLIPAKLPTRLVLWKNFLHMRKMRPFQIHEGMATETATPSSFIYQPK